MTDVVISPYAIRLLGFASREAAVIDALLASQQDSRFRYFCLHEDDLQDPDLYCVNADDVKALATLADLLPSDARPALLIGVGSSASPHACIERPIRLPELLSALDNLMHKKIIALARLAASGAVLVPERRRGSRVPSRLGNPELYLRLRRPRVSGDVLIVDKNPMLSQYAGKLLARPGIAVEWANTEAAVVEHCMRDQTALVIVNTSTPGIDPYALCASIKAGARKPRSVIFLVGRSFDYDAERARQAGCDGFLSKPLNGARLASALKKCLSLTM